MHFFTNYEYEREPQTVTYTQPLPGLQRRSDQHAAREDAGARLDYQFTSQTRLTARYQYYDQVFFDGAVPHPIRRQRFNSTRTRASSRNADHRSSGNRARERGEGRLRALFNRDRDALVKWKGGCVPDQPCSAAPARRGSRFAATYIRGPGNSLLAGTCTRFATIFRTGITRAGNTS